MDDSWPGLGRMLFSPPEVSHIESKDMQLEDPYHEGELAVQELAGEQLNAERNGRAINDSIMPGALKFIDQQMMLVLGSADTDGRMWSSLLTGPAGFATARDQHTIELDLSRAGSHAGDPLWMNIARSSRIGMLAIELTTRRRLRVNGNIEPVSSTEFRIEVIEAYPNCPKYIQRRHLTVPAGSSHDNGLNDPVVTEGTFLNEGIRRWIESADTLFVASAHHQRGADASHRGGNPGFLRVLDDDAIRVPDYAGNSMFNTLGNLHVNPNAGLLLVDFNRGRTLQLTGRATIRFGLEDDPSQPTGGTGRYWDFTPHRWIDARMSHPLRAESLDAWPKNPTAISKRRRQLAASTRSTRGRNYQTIGDSR